MSDAHEGLDRPVYHGLVHAVVACKSCDFTNDNYREAVDAGVQHHRETGHDLTGETAHAVWIGEEGARLRDERADEVMASLFDEETEHCRWHDTIAARQEDAR